MSKRYLRHLVETGLVDGWDDPRMPTIGALRRRGFTPASVREFSERVGVTKSANTVEMGVLESAVRDDLNVTAPRAMAVLDPVKVIIDNFDAHRPVTLEVPNHPGDPGMGTRTIRFGREIYIERGDFMEDPPGKYHRLAPGREVRLRYAYCITCTGVVRDANGDILALHCRYDPETANGRAPDGRKVKGIIHWVNAADCHKATVRLYDRLFKVPNPLADKDGGFDRSLNPESLVVVSRAAVEPRLAEAHAEERFQFERLGYFVADRFDHSTEHPVFNRTVTLRDTWAKLEKT
jgi:glutaminyl-tRNA synthetase